MINETTTTKPLATIYELVRKGGFQPTEYVKNVLSEFSKNKHIFSFWSRQSGKSLSVILAVKQGVEEKAVKYAVICPKKNWSLDLKEKISKVLRGESLTKVSQFCIETLNGSKIDFFSGEMATLENKLIVEGVCQYDAVFFDEFVYTKQTASLVKSLLDLGSKTLPKVWWKFWKRATHIPKVQLFLVTSRSHTPSQSIKDSLKIVESTRFFSVSAVDWHDSWNKNFEETHKQVIGSRSFSTEYEGYRTELALLKGK